jgi:TRAP-type mannitol/chloroaromatic compound transport system permease large subunit
MRPEPSCRLGSLVSIPQCPTHVRFAPNSDQGDNAILASFGLFLVTIFAGLPVGFALLLAAAAYIWTSDIVPMVSLPQNVVNGTSNFVLLALPFFIVAGFIMERGGISLRLVSFVHALVGHLRGGLFQVIVVSMYLVSGLSGSKAADVGSSWNSDARHA